MKYKLTKVTKEWCGVTLFQIEALTSFGNIKKGDKGGFIEKESNLSQYDDAWVYGNAQVSDDACVFGNARVSGNAQVSDDAWVYGNAQVSDDAQVSGNARVSGNAQVSDDARVSGNAQVSGNARVFGNAQVSGNAQVYGKLKLTLGFFFGLRYQKEEIKYVKLDDDYEIICKGDIKIEEDKPGREIKGVDI